MGEPLITKMLVIFIGAIALSFGVAWLLLPLLLTELSRARDAVWGGVALLWGLVLIASSDRIQGSMNFVVVFGALLIVRLGVEVTQNRWHQLSLDEKSALSSFNRWSVRFAELKIVLKQLGANLFSSLNFLQASPKPSKVSKKWIRTEDAISNDLEEPSPSLGPSQDT